MNPIAIQQAMADGAPLTCASCRHFHEGNGFCGRANTCGGPARGLDFPDYDGPVPSDKFTTWCLVCGGGSPAYLIVLGEGKKRFALCKKHKNVYDHINPPNPDEIKHPVMVIALPS